MNICSLTLMLNMVFLFLCSYSSFFLSFSQVINRNNFQATQNQDLQGIDFAESPEHSPTSWPADYQKRKYIYQPFIV